MLIHLLNVRVAYLIFALALLVGCHAKRSVDVRQSLPLSPVGQEIQRRGYHVKESLIAQPTPWEVSTFRMRGRRLFSFRGNQPDPGTTNYFCRFSLFEETYDSVDDARHRLANIHLPDPNGPPEDRDYLSVMRAGFRVGNVTYVLQTDAVSFWDEVQRFAKTLANATKNAELSRAIVDNPRTIFGPGAKI
jgi:hypothetical protein